MFYYQKKGNSIGKSLFISERVLCKFSLFALHFRFSFELVPGQVIRKRIAAVMRSEKGIMMLAKRRQNRHK